MWFDVIEYPNFIEECMSIGYWWGASWEERFKSMGFTTYRFDDPKLYASDEPHWLDSDEFNIFVLRYS